MNSSAGEETIPLLAEEGWRGARARQGEASIEVRPKRMPGLTTPSASLRRLRNIFLMSRPPLLCEEGNIRDGDRLENKIYITQSAGEPDSFQTTRGQEQQLLPMRPLPQTSEWRPERFGLYWTLASRWPPSGLTR